LPSRRPFAHADAERAPAGLNFRRMRGSPMATQVLSASRHMSEFGNLAVPVSVLSGPGMTHRLAGASRTIQRPAVAHYRQ
jgi:hypothetical protein